MFDRARSEPLLRYAALAARGRRRSFKRINDYHSRAVGDEVSESLAWCLTARVERSVDLFCRVGGEEFVLLLPGTASASALSLAATVRGEMTTLPVAAAHIVPKSVTVSIGAASRVANAADLRGRADAALYEAEAGGRDQTGCAPAPRPSRNGGSFLPNQRRNKRYFAAI